MNNLIRYLKDRRRDILFYLLTMLIVLGVPALAGAEPALARYLALLISALFFLLQAAGFLYYRRRRLLLQSFSADLPKLLDMLPAPIDGTECDLFPLISDLATRSAALERQLESEQRDQLGYYTLWVHQIKTPIAAMRLLLDRPGASGNALMRQELFRIEQYADLALRYAKLSDIASDLVIRECSVLATVRECVKKYALLFIYQHLSVTLPQNDRSIYTDKRWLSFVLEQILSNAAKYTQTGGVSITLSGRTLRISDTGIGIRPEDLPRIFEKGYTGYNGRLDSRASGIGLYLAKRAADALAIRIEISSVLGEGTCVSLLLPEHDELSFLP